MMKTYASYNGRPNEEDFKRLDAFLDEVIK